MLISSQQLLFFTLMLLGLVTSISAPSWFMIWLGLELNLMSFIPLMISKSDRFSSEAAFKYFLVQALSSAFIILSLPLLSRKLIHIDYLTIFITQASCSPISLLIPPL